MCVLCKHAVISKRQEPANLTPTAGTPFDILSIDFKGPLASNNYAFVMLDTFTKWVEVFWVTSTSFHAIKKYMGSYFVAHGRPLSIRSDIGPPFQSYEFAEYLKQLNIKHNKVLLNIPSQMKLKIG